MPRVYVKRLCCVSAVYHKGCGSRNCPQGTKVWGQPLPSLPPPPRLTEPTTKALCHPAPLPCVFKMLRMKWGVQ